MERRSLYRIDTKITDVLGHGKFTLSAEVIPPRNGAEQGHVLDQVGTLIEAGAQFLAVTKGAGGSLRGGSLPIAQLIKERFGVPCIAHFTCRDLTPSDVENQLIDHHYFGIRNILALRGDPPDGQPGWRAQEGCYNYAYQLVEQIRALNQGAYLTRPGGPTSAQNETTDFCIGAAVYPEYPNANDRLLFFQKKVEAGAHYGITDMLFDADCYARFLEQCEKRNLKIPILPGTRILKSKPQALRMMSKFKVTVPKEILDALPATDTPDGIRYGVDLFMRLTERLKALGAPGIHLFVIVDTEGASQALRQLSGTQKQVN
jgi:methylenetetrahydrofolate reductase (NADPH)